MKIEIEISEETIQDSFEEAVKERVAQAVASKVRAWGVETEIRRIVDRLWPTTLSRIVEEAMQDLPEARKKATNVLERKLQAQLARAIKLREQMEEE